ncbi:nucleotidyltransferase domain-containing protein [Methylorubrum sp. POS3]|uniref:nucleotidyltransferase domain-containing protein n=1 Tax=Methylorubrum sp. POS3 TaxID=2998492 RepID=UPI00372C3A90
MTPLDDDAWAAWSPRELGQRLRNAIHPWYIAGGWALDIWHGRQTREHEDLEFVVMRNDANYFRVTFNELDFFTVHSGAVEYLPPSAKLPSDVWQLWGADMRQGCWRVDMMMESGTPDRWIYKRNRMIQTARSDAVRVSEAGIPYLSPIQVLLFKAKYCREKDQKDFDLSLPKLSAEERQQLTIWLDDMHPGHTWITKLQRSS